MCLSALTWADLTTALVFLAVFVLVRYGMSSPGTRIPGPFALPIVGNLFMFVRKRQRSHIELLKLKKKYGDVFRLYIGPFRLIVISGYENIHEAFVKHGTNLGHRPNWLPDIKARSETYGYGIVWGNGEEWRRLRRFALQTMRDFGVGKKSLEEIILDEAGLLCEKFATREGQPIDDVKVMMTSSISNVIHHITFGFRYPHDDKTFLRLIKLLDEVFKGPGPLLASLPKWCQIGRLKSSIKSSRKALAHLLQYVTDQIADHEKTYDENNIRDFVDLYIQAQRADKQTNQQKTVNHLFRVILDLFSAGTETTGTSLDWALLYMIAYPEIQQECYNEIEKVVGLGRKVEFSDRKSMPYFEATLLEVQRISNIASMSLPHMNTEEIDVAGYCIPKNSIVMGFLTTSHLDPHHFSDPHVFRPERFIDEVTKTVVHPERLIPFSVGPRACPGESLAKTEMFLVLSNLIQRFRFSKVSDDDVLDFTGVTGITTSACPYRLKVEGRHH
ncbi:cytochrome P450 2J6-like isoform X1 [Crassostrea virginica]